MRVYRGIERVVFTCAKSNGDATSASLERMCILADNVVNIHTFTVSGASPDFTIDVDCFITPYDPHR